MMQYKMDETNKIRVATIKKAFSNYSTSSSRYQTNVKHITAIQRTGRDKFSDILPKIFAPP
jgi:hypothetical protein